MNQKDLMEKLLCSRCLSTQFRLDASIGRRRRHSGAATSFGKQQAEISLLKFVMGNCWGDGATEALCLRSGVGDDAEHRDRRFGT
jgi:hypothetical protein